LLPDFRRKSHEARKYANIHFTKRMGPTHHAVTHMAQKSFLEIEEESKHSIAFTKDKIGKIHVTS